MGRIAGALGVAHVTAPARQLTSQAIATNHRGDTTTRTVAARRRPRVKAFTFAAAAAVALLTGGPAAYADDAGGLGAPGSQNGTSPTQTPAPSVAGASREVRLSDAQVRRMQGALGVHPDGGLGRRTRAAIRRYQRRVGLPATGRLTLDTYRRLLGGSTTRSTPTAPGDVAGAIVAAARARIGADYATGGDGPSSYDCSGLVVEAFADAGIELPRTSFDQYEQGQHVASGDVQPGDLVFFDTDGPGASYVGIATGPTTAISATTSKGVMEHPIDDDYWGGHYLGARRVGVAPGS